MALTPPTYLLASQTVSSSFDQLLYLDSAAGLVEATLKVVGTDTGKSAIQIDDERLLVQGVDTSNAAAFEVKNTGGTSIFKVNASTAGTTTLGTVTVGVNDTGHDVKFFGASSGAYMLWDESQDDLIIGGAGRVGIGVTDPDSALEILNTSTQLKLSYDATNYATFDIAADGMLTITTVDPDGAEADIILAPDGNVGIGTTSPATALDVVIDDSTANGVSTVLTLGHSTSGTADDNIGTEVLFKTEASDGNMKNTASMQAIMTNADEGDSTYDGAIQFRTINAKTWVDSMRITHEGKVGIGTAAPGAPLHIQVDATTASAPIEVLRLGILEATDIELAVGMGPSIDFYVPDTSTGSSTEKIGGRIAVVKENAGDNNNEAGMSFYTSLDGSPSTEKVRIDKDGNVGIGGTDPSAPLEIAQGGDDNEILCLSSSDVAHGMTDYVQTDVFGSFIKEQATAGGLRIVGASDANGNANGALNLQGYLGEAAETGSGTTVNGVIRMQAYVTAGDGGITVPATDSCLLSIESGGTTRFIFDAEGSGKADVEWVAFSDRRLKSSIEDIPYGLSEILQLQPKRFDKESGGFDESGNIVLEGNKKKKIGFIAQDVKTIIPEMVKDINESEAFYSMDDGKLTAVLVKAIQELSAEVDKLKGDA